MAEIYKTFIQDDVVPGDIQTISQPIWSENLNPLSASTATGVGFFTSSTQISQSGNYYVNVYQRNPATDNNAQIQYAVAYGNIDGSGSVGDPNLLSGAGINDTPSRAIYSQYRNMLLAPTDTYFTINGSNTKEIFVINVARSRFRQKVDPGNWELRIGSGSAFASNATKYLSFIDASGQGENPNVNAAGRVFGIYSGSGGLTASSTQYGLFYPDQGIFVFDAGKLRAGGTTGCGLPINSGSGLNAQNHVTMSIAISGSSYFVARSQENVTSTYYFVRVTNKQFNFSNNPTFVTGSGNFRFSSMLRNPSVYITTIGLYDDNNRLLAVAKLSKPLLKSFNREALIKIRLDF